jgi:four helix bundle protein
MRDHNKLRAFQLADSLVIAVYEATRRFPADERFGLTTQLRRGAVSVASNIVEGCARTTEAEYLHFLVIAFGSARELNYQLSLSHRLGFVSSRDYDSLRVGSDEVCRVLNALIRSFRRR